MKNTEIVDIFGDLENLKRVFEIARLGGHPVYLIRGTECSERHKNKLGEELKKHGIAVSEIPEHASIFYELTRQSFEGITRKRKSESFEDILLRIKPHTDRITAKSTPEDEVEDTLRDGSKALLKTAYERLALAPYEVSIIINIAKTIAVLEEKKEIEVHHLAEAIQYRSVLRAELTK